VQPEAQPGAKTGKLVFYLNEQQRYEITKPRFVIGRGKKGTDLVIDDPNISRRHMLVELTNQGGFISDLGSTNGIEFMGQRIKRKDINPGDTFVVCQFQLRFAYE